MGACYCKDCLNQSGNEEIEIKFYNNNIENRNNLLNNINKERKNYIKRGGNNEILYGDINDNSFKDNFYSHRINQSQNNNQKKVFNNDSLKVKGGKKIINDTKYIIRNEDLKFLPKIEIYFNKQINITKDNILQFKKEIQNIIQEIDFSIIEIKKGSLKVLLTLQYIILREFRKNPNLDLSTLSNQFDYNIKKEVKRVAENIRTFPFISLGTTLPTNVNENIIDINNEKSRSEISEKILKMSKKKINDNINMLEISKNLEQFYNNLISQAKAQELNQLGIIEELDEFNQLFDIEIEKYLKESIFEYKITHIFLIEKESQKYKKAKNLCKNTETKILLHGTNVDCITNILKKQFYNAKVHIFGIWSIFY